MLSRKSIENPLYLIGMPGCGKSTVGKLLAERLRLPFTDVDSLIEEQEGKKIHEIFHEDGDNAFRTIEGDWVSQPHSAGVYATGGGLVCYSENARKLTEKGTVVYLKASPAVLKRRISKNSSRPMFSGLEDDEVILFLQELLDRRKKHYQQAHHTIDTDLRTEEEVSIAIQELLFGE